MLKKELILALTEKQPNIAKRDSEIIVSHIIEMLCEAIARGERIEIRGFGVFSLHHRHPALIKNPRSGTTMQVGEKRKVHFKPGLDLRNRVNSEQLNPIK